MTFFEKLTDREPRVLYVLFYETNQKIKFFYTYENTVNCKSDYLLLQMFIGNCLASHTSTYHVLPLYETEVVLTRYKDGWIDRQTDCDSYTASTMFAGGIIT
jgi:hypothetical protein